VRESSIELLPGQYFDRETNLAYNMMRDYDAAIGRYVESDPIGVGQHARMWMADLASTGMKEGPPVAINPYLYVVNNPLKWVDPTGLLEPGQTGPYPMPPGDQCPLVEQVSLGVLPAIFPILPVGLSVWLCVYNCCKTCPPKVDCMVTNIQYSIFGTSIGCRRYIRRPS
jgi:RHS repeat-associated protein